MGSDIFFTVKSVSQGLFKDRGSKFISFAYPVRSEDEIKEILDRTKKEYHDARHCCFAYRLGIEDQYYRANDGGEPNGTAGKPILGQLLSHQLTNILLIVVRYFGGKLLGTSGLINAYRTAAADCIEKALLIGCYDEISFLITFPYSEMNAVMQIIKDNSLSVLEQNADMNCMIKLSGDKKIYSAVADRFLKLKSVKFKMLDD